MPRPKVTEELRRRVAKACLRCQEAKYKCDGSTPCAQCVRRGRESDCEYSGVERTYGRRRRPRTAQRQGEDIGEAHTPKEAGRESAGDQTHSSTSPQPTRAQHVGSESRIPRKSNVLYDTRGRIVYLGDCAAPAFLQHLQGLLESELRLSVEQSGFSKLDAIEEVPPHETKARPPGGPGSTRDLQQLIDGFFDSSCGILDIIDRPRVDYLLYNWRNGSLVDSGRIAVLFLILAYGAQARSATVADAHYSQYYYHQGRRLALLELTDEPRIETIQAFVLISLYMLSSSQRNGSFLNLGIAISAAKSLGIHRDDVNVNFPENIARLRTRLWGTLRYHDLFFCAMMGRTPSTITTDSNYSDKPAQKQSSMTSDSGQQLALSEALRAFSVLEHAVSEGYTKGTASLVHLRRSLAHELQTATSNIPSELRTVPDATRLEPRHVIRNAHVACSYYFSMMLLTRPFLISATREQCSQARVRHVPDPRPSQVNEIAFTSDVKEGALASIESAMHVIQLVHELLVNGVLFNNMVLIIAMVFVASLTICSAHVGRLGSLTSNEQAIRQAEAILNHFSAHTSQGKRYGFILGKIYKATKLYREAVEREGHRAPPLEMPELFSLKAVASQESRRNGSIVPEVGGPDTYTQEAVEKPSGSVPMAEHLGTPRHNPQMPASHDFIDPSLWGSDWQEGLWLTSHDASITDIIDSFVELDKVPRADNPTGSDAQNYSPYDGDSNWDLT